MSTHLKKQSPDGDVSILVELLLIRTSRTFALSIPFLPADLRDQIGIAYLLFRIADTVEDGLLVDPLTKRRLFDELIEALQTGEAAKFCESAAQSPPHDDPDCRDLIRHLPLLLDALSPDPVADEMIRSRVIESCRGMQRFVMAGEIGNVRLKSLSELNDYCYVVAGIVGEMLTELFLHHQPELVRVRAELVRLAPSFGEGLQLVNILKDSESDSLGGRKFVPDGVPRTMLFQRARRDLEEAAEYVRLLENSGAAVGVIRFTQLPVLLAKAALNRVEQFGPGSKISREDVAGIVASVTQSRPTPSTGPTRVLLAEPRGFCAGVRMAVGALSLAMERLGTPLYVFHEIVHNRHIVEDFTSRGAVFVDSIEDVPMGSNLMFSAHGVSPEVRNEARERRLFTIDATCPLVAKVHIEASRFARSGYTILLIGHAGHDEVVGTIGEAPAAIQLISSLADVDALEYSPNDKLAWLTQTTLSVSETSTIVDRLTSRFPWIVGPASDDICYATQNRQGAVESLWEEADAVIVVGSQNSSNSRRLKELADRHGIPAWLVDGADDLCVNDISPYRTLGLTAGASAPEEAVQGVLKWLAKHFSTQVEAHSFTSEDHRFALPSELLAISDLVMKRE